MFLKGLVVIAVMVAIGIAMLSFRQQRYEMMHEMARLHARMDHHRRDLWSAQIDIANHTDPVALAKAIEQRKLELEPVTGPSMNRQSASQVAAAHVIGPTGD